MSTSRAACYADACSGSRAAGAVEPGRPRCSPAPREQHDLPLLLFGIALREAGWRIAFLGADSPIATIESAAASVPATAVVLAAVTPERLNTVEPELTALTSRTRVAIGGAGAEPALVERMGAVLLHGDPVAGATRFARDFDA